MSAVDCHHQDRPDPIVSACFGDPSLDLLSLGNHQVQRRALSDRGERLVGKVTSCCHPADAAEVFGSSLEGQIRPEPGGLLLDVVLVLFGREFQRLVDWVKAVATPRAIEVGPLEREATLHRGDRLVVEALAPQPLTAVRARGLLLLEVGCVELLNGRLQARAEKLKPRLLHVLAELAQLRRHGRAEKRRQGVDPLIEGSMSHGSRLLQGVGRLQNRQRTHRRPSSCRALPLARVGHQRIDEHPLWLRSVTAVLPIHATAPGRGAKLDPVRRPITPSAKPRSVYQRLQQRSLARYPAGAAG